ncbi:aldo/keto reductase [Anaerolineales bacterium HSG6]|nr:aldo/keto reductase [Anaerolineales bacterium HSG6]MDM8532673.1 aldo/keto reductase [Anaerolineales bacterium HSG25]
MKREIQHLGIEISAMGLGCWAIGGPFWADQTPLGWGKVDDNESIRAIHRALELGINFFDTANIYGAGHSERILGRAFAGRRDEVVISTKFNALFDEETRQVTGSDSSSAGIRQACEDSLRRLKTDYIDIYLFHDNGFPAEEAQPVRDTLEALTQEGKIRAYGWSTDFSKNAQFFAEGEHCAAIQVELNVLDDNPGIINICEENNLIAINRGPLAMGLLTGKYSKDVSLSADDVRGQNSPEWMKYFKNGKPSPEFMQMAEAIREILTSNGRTVAQGALAWLWARSETTIPIPGFRTVAQVEDNGGAMDKGPLSLSQMDEIAQILGRDK